MVQTADTVMMIRPVAFRSNPQTAASNAFQDVDAMPDARAHAGAVAEFDAVVSALRGAGVRVLVADDTLEPPRPDAVFPNNWISTHDDGAVVLYPMHALNRRAEVRRDLVDALANEHGFHIGRVIDFSPWADRGLALEGTGSMALDRVAKVAYAVLSSRTDREVLDAWCGELGYEACVFDAAGPDGTAIYHTNVMMWIGERCAGICLDAIRDSGERRRVRDRLAGDRTVIDLTAAQMGAFAGNALQMRTRDGSKVIALSRAAFDSLRDDQREMMFDGVTPVVADLGVIETCSGGSVRCMLAEVFLPAAEKSE